jgi:7-cyano-7-deazaguanine synthase
VKHLENEGHVVAFSGGMDSTAMLSRMMYRHKIPKAKIWLVAFYYGSKHNEYENKAAAAVAKHYGTTLETIDLSGVMEHFESDLLKSGGDIPEGHYEDQSMNQTVVPGRNMIFASILAGYAWSVEASRVWMGIHAGDHAIYPDCRPAFYHSMAAAFQTGTDNRVHLLAPFLNMTKGDIVADGLSTGTPFELTRTCYKDQDTACGRCGSCQERLAAFNETGVADPIQYESRDIVEMVI